MAVTPQTNLKILKCPLTLNNKHQLTFSNKTAQYNYFNGLSSIEIDDISYQRKDNIIRFPAHIDSILSYNYCMYQNENYNNKWFYAFITNMRYINDGMTEISISTDVFQTWQFDLDFKESFVEREMINSSDDVPGANLEPENLETGEFKVQGTAEFDELEVIPVVAYSGEQIVDSVSGITFNIDQSGYIINGIPSSVAFLFTSTFQAYNNLMGLLQQANNSSFIVASFTVPKLALKDVMTESHVLIPDPTFNRDITYVLEGNSTYENKPLIKTLLSIPSQLDGYTPVNKKLLTYPYLYLGFNPNNGNSKVFRYEDFSEGTPKFKMISEVNPNPTIIFIPQNYRGESGDSLADISTLGGYPTLSSREDVYNTWLAQNSNIISLRMQNEERNYELNTYQRAIQGTADIVGNSFSLDVVGSLGAGANLGLDLARQDINHEYYIANQMAQVEKQSMLPDNVSMGNSNATLLGYNMLDKNIFTRYSIKRQFAEKIDKYFSMYGYLTNTLKVPNLMNRPNWNYVKLIGANILANIPQTDLEIIKNMFNNGITLWHNTNTFLDYSQNNK